ncbi:MAG: TonB-dependent receptor [Candidatus Polarisedimenticolia bacterium]
MIGAIELLMIPMLWALAAAEENATAGREGAQGAPVTVSVQGDLPYIPTSNTIATRLPLLLRLTPANVGVVSDVVMREQKAEVLGDALENVSGVDVQSFNGVADFFTIRGFDAQSSGLVLVDGAPEPEVTFYPMYNAERVEVFKGPAGFLYGSNPLAGAVNIVRRQPVAGAFTRGGASFGSFSTYDITVDHNMSSDDGTRSFRLQGLWRESDTFRDNMENDTLAVNPAFTWRPDGATSVNVNLEYARSNYMPDSGLPLVNFGTRIADVPREREYQSPFDVSDQQLSRAQVDVEHRVNDAWSLRNKTYYRQLDWESDGTIFFGVFDFGPLGEQVGRSLLLLDDQQQFMGNQAEAILSAATGPVKHQILMGLDLSWQGDEFTLDNTVLPFIGVDDPVETATRPFAVTPVQAGDARSVIVAPYVIDQIQFSEKWFALAGARFDMIDFEDDNAFSPDPNIGVFTVNRSDSKLSPMGGVVFSPTSELSFYANAARSFAPAGARVQDEDREPEESRQIEVGTKVGVLGGKLQMTVAAYNVERDNIGIPDDNGITTQAGDQRSRGIEFEASGEVRKNLRVLGAYAYNDAELTEFTELVLFPVPATFDRTGNTPAFAPRHLASLWVSQGFENGLGLAGGGRYVGEQFISEDNVYEMDPYIVYDAAVSWKLEQWEMGLNLKNIGSRDYETRGFGSFAILPAPPFMALASVRYTF